MYQSNWSFNMRPPRESPGHLNFWRLACSNSLPSGQKSRSNAPPIRTEIPFLKDKYDLQSNTVHAFQREICCNDTFKLLYRPFWESFSLTKPKFYLGNLSNPAKTDKTHGRITLQQKINLVQIPRPSKATFKFPPPRPLCSVKCPRYARGDVEASIWSVLDCEEANNL